MALSKVDYNSMNVTPAASKAIKFNSSNNGLETGDLAENLVLIQTQTLSSAADSIDFTSNIDSTYKEYIFKYTNIHPASVAQLSINFRDGSTAFDASKASTAINPYHVENDSAATVIYRTAWDLANSTSDQIIAQELGNGADESANGYLCLFEPSSTTFVKHFIGVTDYYQQFGGGGPFQVYYAGYCNTTTAIDGVTFKMSSGQIESGTIKMYGVK